MGAPRPKVKLGLQDSPRELNDLLQQMMNLKPEARPSLNEVELAISRISRRLG